MTGLGRGAGGEDGIGGRGTLGGRWVFWDGVGTVLGRRGGGGVLVW